MDRVCSSAFPWEMFIKYLLQEWTTAYLEAFYSNGFSNLWPALPLWFGFESVSSDSVNSSSLGVRKWRTIAPLKKKQNKLHPSYILRIDPHLRNIKYYDCRQVQAMTPSMTSLWQWMLLSNGELDEVTGLIPSGTQGFGGVKLLLFWETHQLLAWQSEWSGGRVSSVPRILLPFSTYQGLWCSSQCHWEEIKVLSSNPNLEIPFGRNLQLIG